MAKGVFIVQNAPVDGREDDYNNWYNDVHLPEILQIAGFTSARRFRKLQGEGMPYLAMYEVEADDLEAAQASIGKAAANGELRMSDALDRASSKMALYEQIAEREA
jgi:hypothetical protein